MISDDVTVEAADAAAVAADTRFWSLYDGAFPNDEREPRAVILDAARAGVGLIVRAQRRGETIALGSAHRLIDPPALFLVYLAVDAAERGRGLGTALFDHLWQAASGCLIWEVDPPSLAPDESELERRQRRIEFFRRAGGALIDRDYFQPPLEAGAPPVPMRLMARPEPDEATVTRLIRAIYFEKYGAQNGITTATLRALLDR